MNLKKLEEFLFRKIEETKLPSLSVAVFHKGGIVYAKTWGYSDIEENKPATLDTLYGIGSISKSFTCLAIMKLVERGLMSLSDSVSKYVPLDLSNVMIYHLMSHSSGIPGLGYAEALIRQQVSASQKWLPVADTDDLLTFMSDVKAWHLFKPGEKWFYLNEGYELLERIVEIVSGMEYKEFIKSEIFSPLGINCSFIEDQDEKLASPYYLKDGILVKSRTLGGPMNGAGGITCSASDLAKYGYTYVSKNGVVSPRLIEEMEKPRMRIPYEIPYGNYHYGYGLMIMDDFLGRKVIGHGGSVLVYTAHLLYSREEDISIAVLSNSSGYPMKNFALYLLATFLGEDPEKLSFVRTDDILSSLTGVYRTYHGTISSNIKRSGDFLILELFEDVSPVEMVLVPERLERDHTLFYTLSSGSKIPVQFIRKGDKTLMVYERYVFEKV